MDMWRGRLRRVYSYEKWSLSWIRMWRAGHSWGRQFGCSVPAGTKQAHWLCACLCIYVISISWIDASPLCEYVYVLHVQCEVKDVLCRYVCSLVHHSNSIGICQLTNVPLESAWVVWTRSRYFVFLSFVWNYPQSPDEGLNRNIVTLYFRLFLHFWDLSHFSL